MRRSSYMSTRRAAFSIAAVATTFMMATESTWAQQARLFVSSREGDRISAKPAANLQPVSADAGPTFRIDEATRHQTIAGFGASFLEAGMICINDLPPQTQEAVLRTLFDPQAGAGFSAMKTTIAGTDFMSAGPWYTYDDTPGDLSLYHFSIARDLGPSGLVTYIKRARKYGNFVLQAPMDYPPDWMLVDVNHNQDVREDASTRLLITTCGTSRSIGSKASRSTTFACSTSQAFIRRSPMTRSGDSSGTTWDRS